MLMQSRFLTGLNVVDSKTILSEETRKTEEFQFSNSNSDEKPSDSKLCTNKNRDDQYYLRPRCQNSLANPKTPIKYHQYRKSVVKAKHNPLEDTKINHSRKKRFINYWTHEEVSFINN